MNGCSRPYVVVGRGGDAGPHPRGILPKLDTNGHQATLKDFVGVLVKNPDPPVKFDYSSIVALLWVPHPSARRVLVLEMKMI